MCRAGCSACSQDCVDRLRLRDEPFLKPRDLFLISLSSMSWSTNEVQDGPTLRLLEEDLVVLDELVGREAFALEIALRCLADIPGDHAIGATTKRCVKGKAANLPV